MRKYWIIVVVSLIMKLSFVFMFPIATEAEDMAISSEPLDSVRNDSTHSMVLASSDIRAGDEVAHWRYVREIQNTGHPLNVSELWLSGHATYQASNNPFYYYVNSLLGTMTQGRLLSVAISILALILFASVCYRYSMWWTFLFLAILPASIISVSRVGGDCWVYSIVLMMIYAYDQRKHTLLLLLAVLAANLRMEGLAIAGIVWLYVCREWFTDWSKVTYLRWLTILASATTIVTALLIYVDRLPLLRSGHSFNSVSLESLFGMQNGLNQAFISLWFHVGNEKYFSLWFLLVPAILLSWIFTKRFYTIACDTFRDNWAIVLIVLITVGIFVASTFSQTASCGRYLLNFIPWMAYLIYKEQHKTSAVA